MQGKRNYLWILVLIGMISISGLADTGIFVKDFFTNDNKNNPLFAEAEEVEIKAENESTYMIEKNSIGYEIPREYILKVPVNKNYIVIDNSINIVDKPNINGKALVSLKKGDIAYLERISGDFGYFSLNNGTKGFALLKGFELYNNEQKADALLGISKVSTVLKSNNVYYVLAKGEEVLLRKKGDSSFVVVDEYGNEFKAPKGSVEISQKANISSRSMISRRSSSLSKIVSTAYSLVGSPYAYAGTGERGYDCSGFTYSVYKKSIGIELPRSSRDQVNMGLSVNKSDLIPGDLLFFNTSGSGISHVGLYVGDGKMIHASSGAKKVQVTSISESYYVKRYISAKRIITN